MTIRSAQHAQRSKANDHYGRGRRPSFTDRIELWLSTGKRIDGLWVGTLEGKAKPILQRVEVALTLIKAYDRPRYGHLVRDLDRVWVRVITVGLGCYSASINACELDTRFVLAETSTPESIAATIVHEATHARLARCGIGYEEGLRARVEAVCLRREIAFAARLPNGEQVREMAQRSLSLCNDDAAWTDTAFDERHVEGAKEALRHLGTPEWLVRAILILRACRRCIRGLMGR